MQIIPDNGQDRHSTEYLEEVLKQARPRNLGDYLEQNANEMLDNERPFTAYVRQIIKKNSVSQRDMFITANISETYGYKLISMEKITKNRDLIIRLCLAAHMSLKEADRALKLYGMSPLYPKIGRDAALIIAFNTRMYDMGDVDDLLTENGFESIYNYDDED